MAYVSALICCDAAVPARGCWTLVNTFDALEFAAFPAHHRGWDILIGMSDVLSTDEIDLEVEVIDSSAEAQDLPGALIYYDIGAVTPGGRLTRAWKRFHTGAVEIVRPGTLDVRLLWNGNLQELGTLQVREA